MPFRVTKERRFFRKDEVLYILPTSLSRLKETLSRSKLLGAKVHVPFEYVGASIDCLVLGYLTDEVSQLI